MPTAAVALAAGDAAASLAGAAPDLAKLKRAAEDRAIAAFREQGAGGESENRARALATARATSYAMSGKSLAEATERDLADAWQAIAGEIGYKRARVQSVLGGAFLRMYLDGKVDDALVAAAGEEIAAAPEFAKLAADVQSHLARSPIDPANPEPELKARADGYLRSRLKHGGIAFRYELNPVIGGIGGVAAKEATSTAADGAIAYTIGVELTDTYDFQNKRTGEYDRYRRRLAALLAAGRYEDFWEAYLREAFGVRRITTLDSAALFASFMYAIEAKGWTPGALTWRVVVPMRGSVKTRPRKPKRATP
jgi:hypothetical protein